MYTLKPAPVTKSRNMIWTLFVCAIVIATIGTVLFGVLSARSNPRVFSADGQQIRGPALPTASDTDACSVAQGFVRDSLKAPTTATFPNNCQAKQTAGTWIVTSYVDSENGFGAMLRSDTVVQMTYDPSGDSWALVDIAIVGR